MKKLLVLTAVLLLAASFSYAQNSLTGTTNLQLTVGSEAGIVVTGTTVFTAGSGSFADYSATTPLTYYIRTGSSVATAGITLRVTTDFDCLGGPCVLTPVSSGDALTYLNTVQAPGTAVSGMQTASTTVSTPVATFGANVQSAKTGNTASVAWTLTNDPAYKAGTYNTAIVTFTISAT